jgi:hypothetical protein
MLAVKPGSDHPGRHSQEAGMDAGLTVKPVAGVAVVDYARPAAAAGQAVTPTDLPEAKAVNPTAVVPSTRNDTTRPEASPDAAYVTRSLVIDPQSREVIYRVMDMRTRQVLWQLPDAALLRNKAYARSLNSAPQPGAAKRQTNVMG